MSLQHLESLNMSLSNAQNIEIICQSEDLYRWITLTLKLSHLRINRLSAKQVDSLNLSNNLKKKSHLLIIDEVSFTQLITRLKVQSISVLPFPLLVLTDTFKTKRKPAGLKLTFDTLPIPIITINLLQHAITSLLKDFEQTTLLIKLAHYDPLTKAANRLLFDDRLSQSLKRIKRYKEPLGLIYFDLDEFKPVNDNYGHAVGDELLKRFVTLIKSEIRDSDTLARMGGDEFALLLSNSNKENLQTVAKKILTSLKQPQLFNNIELEIKASLGAVAVNHPCGGKLTNSELLKLADKSVYKAKETKGSSVEFDFSCYNEN